MLSILSTAMAFMSLKGVDGIEFGGFWHKHVQVTAIHYVFGIAGHLREMLRYIDLAVMFWMC